MLSAISSDTYAELSCSRAARVLRFGPTKVMFVIGLHFVFACVLLYLTCRSGLCRRMYQDASENREFAPGNTLIVKNAGLGQW